MTQGSPLISLRRVFKTYASPSGDFTALKEVNLQVQKGEFAAIVGKSGSGKSTLINVITGIDSPTSGEVFVASTAIHSLNQEQLAIWRGKNVGVIFQFFQLLPTLTVAENVMLPMDFCHTYPARERRERAVALLSKVGIAEQADKLPSDLSGGQQQRAAIARALANDPPILVADEPTGNLDSHTTDVVLNLFAELASEGKTVVMVTHERDLSRYFTRSILLSDGAIVSNTAAVKEALHHA
ncbi:ABC transporter ATP-binding protein [Paenibacillus sp. JMULE4]|uniref:ABC transporter ATP-binding protein n=1 Tax=unclassified Paenibacillus TaxID=185978 RepID=UPI00071EC589|nr:MULTISPECIES: ABC transporter ATP-binding protein [Paenibacillaceae]ALS28915.1 peptide ABC transporter ATP-binding protein [Paenibacillus sp. 32O-W]NTZ20689.1 ABC transporter ATP-binding protein [Paenibacillus sp. JMULE4]